MFSGNTKLGIPHKTISSIKFTCLKNEEIRNLSVKRASNPFSFDSLNRAVASGLYDPAYGPISYSENCQTCFQFSRTCVGHSGHIELPLPVYNPLFLQQILNLLQASCQHCKRFYAKEQDVNSLLAHWEISNQKDIYLQQKKDNSNVANNDIERAVNLPAEDNLNHSKNEIQIKDSCCENYSSPKWTRHTINSHLKRFNDFIQFLTKNKENRFCTHCKRKCVSFSVEALSRIYIKDSSKIKQHSYVTPSFVRDHLNAVWKNEQNVLTKIFGVMNHIYNVSDQSVSNGIDSFFLDTLFLPASRFRPAPVYRDRHIENVQTAIYAKIITNCKVLSLLLKKLSATENEVIQNLDSGSIDLKMKNEDITLIPGNTFSEKIGNSWQYLQQHVNMLYDSDLNPNLKLNVSSFIGIRQCLEKKQGLFRQNMMGKRVNFAARSVISPDPYIATNEIGIPYVFASKLTYPTAVTSFNIRHLRQAVINGPMGYPGAVYVIKRGHKIFLSANDASQRLALAKQLVICEDDNDANSPFQHPNIVGRYLENGDVLLLNRQPTLHRGSIMAHKARVLPNEKTLRLHYANCKSYNADFDGDEMNAHYPQSELARSEAVNLMLTDKQYLSAKDGKPLSCLIQDHIVAGVNMSIRGRFFQEDEYHNLVYNALTHISVNIKLLPPTFIKPKKLWSGKQILSTLLINIIPDKSGFISLVSKSKISQKDWTNEQCRQPQIGYLKNGEMCESEVVIRHGHLLCGILDKAHYGASEYGLIHVLYEVYGGDISGKMLTSLARLFTSFLQIYEGFTLGVADILTTPEGNIQRKDIVETSKKIVSASLGSRLNLPCSNEEGLHKIAKQAHSAFYLGQKEGKQLIGAIDHSMKTLSSSCNDQISSSCSGEGLLKSFPDNNLQLMVRSGAKGGLVNCLQISCSLGQIDLEGKRPCQTIAGRTCPSFKPFDMSIRAGGFVSQRFLTGLRPQEYFFHCMAGREGLVDTAVKTSNSGYLQRCLVKSLESLILSYDMTVRDNDGVVVQFLYGEDGVDVGKSPFLQYKQFGFLINNFQIVTKQLSSFKNIQNVFNTKVTSKRWKKYVKTKKKIKSLGDQLCVRTSGFIDFGKTFPVNTASVKILNKWKGLSKHEQDCFCKNSKRFLFKDPILSQFRPDLHFGSVSECFYDNIHKYLKSSEFNVKSSQLNGFDKLETIFNLRYQRSLCEPGENVGLLAAQSIGEPSTQMTLNTFHFAGRGEMNVTLGIPRLREILMFCSRFPSTPHITIPVLCGKEKEAEKVCKKLSTVSLNEALQKYSVEECLVNNNKLCCKNFVLTFQILPKKHLMEKFGLTPLFVMKHIEMQFVPALIERIASEIKKSTSSGFIYNQSNVDSTKQAYNDLETRERNEESTADVLDDQDATMEILKQKKTEEVEYDQDLSESDNDNDNPDMNSKNKENDDDSNSDCDEALKTLNSKSDYEGIISSSKDDVILKDIKQNKSGSCDISISMPLNSFNVNLVSLVQLVLQKSFLRKTANISRCMLVSDKSANNPMRKKLIIDGYNFGKVFENQHCLEVKSLYSNHITAIMNYYGIEAARRVIEQEVVNVFAVYGIEIDRRHLSVVSDYMCNSGIPQGCNRTGIKDCSSAFQKITFEVGCRFISEAAMHEFTDNMDSPSANMIAGQLVKTGTGSFSLLQPMNA